MICGERADRKKISIKENVEFIITDVGEVEYTPKESELTSQDFVEIPKTKPGSLRHLFLPIRHDTEEVIRNRVVRAIYCTTKNESHRRHFLLEVNEQPCDIRPIASAGSKELRYLHSTENLFNYILKYGNDTSLYVKLFRGDLPTKAVEFDGYMVFRSVLDGDSIPMCRTDNLEMTLISPDLPVRVKLPIGDDNWRSLREIRAAELQCMQLSIQLLSRHESEMYVTIETEKNLSNYLQTDSNHGQRTENFRRSSDESRRQIEECEQIPDRQFVGSKQKTIVPVGRTTQITRNLSGEERKSIKPITPKLTRSLPLSHPLSDQLYRNDEQRLSQVQNRKIAHQRILEQKEKFKQSQQTFVRSESKPSSTLPSSNNGKTRANIV